MVFRDNFLFKAALATITDIIKTAAVSYTKKNRYKFMESLRESCSVPVSVCFSSQIPSNEVYCAD